MILATVATATERERGGGRETACMLTHWGYVIAMQTAVCLAPRVVVEGCEEVERERRRGKTDTKPRNPAIITHTLKAFLWRLNEAGRPVTPPPPRHVHNNAVGDKSHTATPSDRRKNGNPDNKALSDINPDPRHQIFKMKPVKPQERPSQS